MLFQDKIIKKDLLLFLDRRYCKYVCQIIIMKKIRFLFKEDAGRASFAG